MQVQLKDQSHGSITQLFLDTIESEYGKSVLTRKPQLSAKPEVLTEIYKDDCNIAIWQRRLPPAFTSILQQDIKQRPLKNYNIQVASDCIENDISDIAIDREYGSTLRSHIAETIDMFCTLFDTPRVGLRLATLDKAMRPRFHVDKVPCRLVSTFVGKATQYLEHDNVDRSRLGHGSQGKPDDKSGLYQHSQDIKQLQCADVALLKGETWENNEGAGLVHRSPALERGEVRLLMTLDFVI